MSLFWDVEGNTEVWLKVGSPVAFVEAGAEVYKDENSAITVTATTWQCNG